MFPSSRHLLLLPVLFLIISCDPKEHKVRTTGKAPTTEAGKSYRTLQTPLIENILIPFEHNILLDMSSGSDGKIMRKLLIQTIHIPVDDASKQLNGSLDLAGYKALGHLEGDQTYLDAWSKDGKILPETSLGLSIQANPGPDATDPAVTGILTIDIFSLRRIDPGMQTLQPPVAVKTILSFDFDGTLHHPADQPPVPGEFFEVIRHLREDQGAIWGINTGRSMPQMIEGFIESRFPFLPDWVVAREREIHFPNAFGRWIPHQDWNTRCEKEIHRLFKKAGKLLATLRSEVEEHTGAQWIEMDGEPAGIISRTEEEMEWIAAHITPLAADVPQLGWQRNSIYLRFGHRSYQKGSSLTEIARQYGLETSHCFAIGDSHNDLEMLDAAHSGMAACPANAVNAIREKVLSRQGFVSPLAHGHGSVSALRHYFNV